MDGRWDLGGAGVGIVEAGSLEDGVEGGEVGAAEEVRRVLGVLDALRAQDEGLVAWRSHYSGPLLSLSLCSGEE